MTFESIRARTSCRDNDDTRQEWERYIHSWTHVPGQWPIEQVELDHSIQLLLVAWLRVIVVRAHLFNSTVLSQPADRPRTQTGDWAIQWYSAVLELQLHSEAVASEWGNAAATQRRLLKLNET